MLRKLFAALLFFAFLIPPAWAQTIMAGDLHISAPWARASVVQTGAAYVTIENRGSADDRLLSVETEVAGAPQLHEHAMQDGVMRMRQVEGGIPIPAGETVVLEPGGYHMMLMGLNRHLVEGESFKITLRFERAGAVELSVPVRAAAAQDSGHGNHGGDGNHGHGD